MEANLKILLRGCANKAEADKVAAAYLREAKGKETLIDRVLLTRKRKETGAKKPDRRPPPHPKQNQPPESARPPPQFSRPPPKPAEPVKPVLKPASPVSPSPSPVKYSSPELIRKVPLAETKPQPRKGPVIQSDSSSSDEDDDTSKRKEAVSPSPKKTAAEKVTSEKNTTNTDHRIAPQPKSAVKAADTAGPNSQKQLSDYYSRKGSTADYQNKTVVRNKKPNHASYYASMTGKSPPLKVRKKKKKKPKKAQKGYDNYSDSSDTETDSEPDTKKQITTERKPTAAAPSASEESSDSEDEKVAKKRSTVAAANKVKPKDDSSDSDDSETSKATSTNTKNKTRDRENSIAKESADKNAKQTNKSTKKSELPEKSKKVSAEVTEVAKAKLTENVTNTSNASETATTEAATSKKDKGVRWDSDVTSPKPTERKSKKEKRKAARKKTKLESVREADEQEETTTNELVMEKQPVVLDISQSEDKVKRSSPEAEARLQSAASPTHKSETAESDSSSHVSHVDEKPALAGPFYPSTLSLQSRKSQRDAEAQLQPSYSDRKDELKQQLSAMEDIGDLERETSLVKPEIKSAPEAPLVTEVPTEKPQKAEHKSRDLKKKTAADERKLSPFQVLPEIPSKKDKKPVWPSLAKLQRKPDREKTGDSLIVYAKPHKKGGKRERKDFGPYIDVLDKACDSDLQYIIAKTGVTLGVDKPASVAKARMTQMLSQRRTAKLDQKVLKRLQNENGAYKKRIDKFLGKV